MNESEVSDSGIVMFARTGRLTRLMRLIGSLRLKIFKELFLMVKFRSDPVVHERCLTADREQARAAAKDLVSEDGPVHKSPGPSTFAH